MIYFVTFIESFCGGLTAINQVLYLKFILKFTEAQTATFLSVFGVVSTLFILFLGPMVDKLGVKKSSIIGTIGVILGRFLLYFCPNPISLVTANLIASAGSAIKVSSITVFLKQNNKSFKLDYIIFNLAYVVAGIAFDYINDYKLIYLITALISLINIWGFYILKSDKPEIIHKEHKPINWKTFCTVLAYNCMVVPVSCIFVWQNSGLPKWILEVLGPNAPVGKLSSSLNPLLILITIPLFSWIDKYIKLSSYYWLIIGSLISAFAYVLPIFPMTYMNMLILSTIIFTIGEAIWSPSNMETAAKICPDGEEGRYMTISLIPRRLGAIFMGYFIAYNMTHYVYNSNHDYNMPFYLLAALALITPITLLFFRSTFKQLD